jgi:hypothetical protein
MLFWIERGLNVPIINKSNALAIIIMAMSALRLCDVVKNE